MKSMVAPATEMIGLRRFNIDEYHRMAEAGVFGPEEHVELIRGVIRLISPKGRRHVIAVTRCNKLFVLRLADRATVYVQDPLVMRGGDSEPEPDVAILSSPDPAAYGTDESRPLLIIEVADSSLDYDRRIKAPLYAGAKIPEYWLVNLVDEWIEVHRSPGGGAYASTLTMKRGETLAPLAWPDLEIRVDELLP